MLFTGLTFGQISVYYYDHYILDETGFDLGEDQQSFEEWANNNGVHQNTHHYHVAQSVYMTWWELGIIRPLLPSGEMYRCE